jgi:hypothetical protein
VGTRWVRLQGRKRGGGRGGGLTITECVERDGRQGYKTGMHKRKHGLWHGMQMQNAIMSRCANTVRMTSALAC